MKRSTNTNTSSSSERLYSTNSNPSPSLLRTTYISHLRKGQQQKKSKPNPCVLITGVITTILMTFVYLVTSSLHRTMLEENQLYQQQKMQQMKYNQQQQQQQQEGHTYQTRRGYGWNQSNGDKILFVTVVLPSVVNPSGRKKRLDSITQTWGIEANAIYVVHDMDEYGFVPSPSTNKNVNDGSIAAAAAAVGAVGAVGATGASSIVGIGHEEDEEFSTATTASSSTTTNNNSPPSPSDIYFPQTLYVPPSIATVDQGVQRLQYVMETIYKEYDPDYAFFVNDHTFVIPQHICTFLGNQKRNSNNMDGIDSHHLYAGHALKPKGTKYAFNSGAAGYFLSRETMKGLIEKQRDPKVEKDCKGDRKWLQGNPGLVTANCLKETMGVDPVDTRDDLGRYVFHAYGVIRTVKGEFDAWYVNKHATLREIWGEDKKNQYEIKKGKDCCSPDTISFHYVEFAETLALYATFQKIIDAGGASNISDDQLQQFMLAIWPKDKKDIGGYSHNLPPVSKKDIWDDLLHVIKSIAPTEKFNGCHTGGS